MSVWGLVPEHSAIDHGTDTAHLGTLTTVFCGRWLRPGAGRRANGRPNTWSCVGFILVGFWIWRRARAGQHASLRVVGVASILMGLGSAFYHASGTWIGMLADYSGMFMGSSLMVALNLRRWLGWRFGALLGVFLALTTLFLASTVVLPGAERWVFAFGSPCWLIELRLFFRDRLETTYRCLLWGYFAVGVAALFWWLWKRRRGMKTDRSEQT